MISNYNTYDVAVMNYPLFDKEIDLELYRKKLFSQATQDSYKVPIYVHIPFCESLCDFCIYSRICAKSGSEIVEEYVYMLIKEIELYSKQDSIKKLSIGSVFIGGGTPTVLNERQLEKLITKLKDCFDIECREITVECNFNNATESKLKLLRQLGVTRISTGIQTFQQEMRQKLHMSGSRKEVIEWLDKAKTYGFKEVSGDLIYGFPDTNLLAWKEDLKQCISLSLDHISIYKLTIFAHTVLYKNIEKYHYTMLNPEQIYKMFLEAHNYLRECGYELQSTQEYGRPDSKTEFWENTYDGYGANLSFGTASFGFLNGYCYQNESSIEKYIQILKKGQIPVARMSKQSTTIQLMERSIVMGMRRGYVEKEPFRREYGKEIKDVFSEVLRKLIEKGYISEESNRYVLTPEGVYHQGEVSSEFMVSIFKGTSPLTKKFCVGMHEMPHRKKKGDRVIE